MRQPPQKTESFSERRIATHTTRKTVSRLTRKQLYFKLCSFRTTKGGINLTQLRNKVLSDSYKKHKNFSRQRHSFFEVKLRRLRRKRTRTNMLSVVRTNILYLQTIQIKQPNPASQYRIQISNMFTENLIFSSAKAKTSLETKNISWNL